MIDRLYQTAAAALASLSLAGASFADPAGPAPEGYYHMWGGGYGMMGGGIMVLSWIAIIVVIVLAVKWLIDRDGSAGRGASSSALETLKMRFARGEIDAKEYEERRKLLQD